METARFISCRIVRYWQRQARARCCSTNNLWKVAEIGGKPVQLTHFDDGSLFFPSISADGKIIVFEENAGLWKLDTVTGKVSEVKIEIGTDSKENNFEALHINGEADSYGLSPSSQRAAISAHGEIFTIATEHGDVSRVTHSYSRETEPAWSPDGKWIAYVSDEGGRDSVWVADPDGSNAKKLTDTDNEKLNVGWMPDSKARSSCDQSFVRLKRCRFSPNCRRISMSGRGRRCSLSIYSR